MREAFDTLAPFLSALIGLRKCLHEKPELSGTEEHTAEKIRHLFSLYEPDNIFSGIGAHGIAVVFEGKKPGPTVFRRCELDAVSIQDLNGFQYRSRKPNVSRVCGHDGDMTIVAALGSILANEPPCSKLQGIQCQSPLP